MLQEGKMKQWILIGSGVALLVLYLLWPGSGASQQGDKVVASDRVLLDRAWRAKPERQMTIGEMEQYAAGLSDDDLWTEIQVSYEKWMEVNGAREYKIPPRLAVMLAREVGRRRGTAGVWKIANFLKEKEVRWDFDEEVRERAQSLRYLRENLNYATFGGWASVQPAEAICWLIKLSEEDERNRPFVAVNAQTLDSFPLPEFWVYERVVREAFGQLMSRDIKRAIELLKEGGEKGVFDVNQAIEAMIPRLIVREEWELMHVMADDNGPFIPRVNFEVWSDDIVEKVVKLNEADLQSWQRLKLIEVLARARPTKASEIIVHPEASAELRQTLLFTTALYGTRHLRLMSKQEIPSFINELMFMSSVHRFGPIDGREGGWIPDWEEHHRVMAEVVEGSELEAEEKSRYLGMIEESRGRLDE